MRSACLLAAVLAFVPWPGAATAPEPAALPAWAGELGLRRSSAGELLCELKSLTAGQAEKVERFLGALDPAAHPAWFSPDGQGGFTLTQRGKRELPPLLLGEAPAAPGTEVSLPPPVLYSAKLDKDLAASAAAAAEPEAAFDGAGKAPRPMPPLYAGYGVWPAAVVRSRDLQSIYHAYGWATDRYLVPAIEGPHPSAGEKAAARTMKAFLLDIPIGLIGSFWQHELGHFESAWSVGAGVSWSHSGQTNVGGILGESAVNDADWQRMTVAQRMNFNGAGIFSSQSGADAGRRDMLSGDRVDWSWLPFWTFQKMDASLYGFITPKPGQTSPSETAFDTVQWRDSYAQRSQRSPALVQRDIVAGAAFNALDPLAVWAAYSYFVDYLAKGRERLPNPMVSAGDVSLMPGTGFWLSEVGPQYLLSLLARDKKSGTLVQATAAAGDDSQGSVTARVENIPLGGGAVGRLMAAIWEQRARAEPGPKSSGGAFGFGVDLPVGGGFSVSTDMGAKGRGALLGLPFAAGPYVMSGLKLDVSPDFRGR